MIRTTRGQLGLQFFLSLISAASFSMIAHEASAGLAQITAGDGTTGFIARTAIAQTSIAAMPVVEGSGFSSAGVSQHNLGTFDIVINPSGPLSGNAAALAAFNRAAQAWESIIADPITVTINADFSALGPGILGSASSVILGTDYNTIRNALVADAADEANDAIVASMPTAAQFLATVPGGFSLDGDLIGTKANLKAIGFPGLDAQFGVADANIAFSTGFTFDFDKSNGITAGAFDFEGIAAHEIGHALGFISAVDSIDSILNLNGTAAIAPAIMDLFRFRNGTNDPESAAQFTTFARHLVPTNAQAANFDQIIPEAGAAVELPMSMGRFFGDGQQASHFKDNLTIGIMDPTAAPGELLVIRPADMRVFDLIGYEIAAIPEAGAWAFGGVATCFLGVGAFVKRRRKP